MPAAYTGLGADKVQEWKRSRKFAKRYIELKKLGEVIDTAPLEKDEKTVETASDNQKRLRLQRFTQKVQAPASPVSYTHLTLPTIYSV